MKMLQTIMTFFVLIVLLNHLERKPRIEIHYYACNAERAKNHNDNHSQKFTMPLSDMNQSPAIFR